MRGRILGSMVLVTFAAVLAFAIPLAAAASRVYREREVSRLEREATAAEGALPPGGLRSGAQLALAAHPEDVRIALYDRHGLLVTGDGLKTPGVVADRVDLVRVAPDADALLELLGVTA